jgi:hypothetical protein
MWTPHSSDQRLNNLKTRCRIPNIGETASTSTRQNSPVPRRVQLELDAILDITIKRWLGSH